jgi:hypothetical protein
MMMMMVMVIVMTMVMEMGGIDMAMPAQQALTLV